MIRRTTLLALLLFAVTVGADQQALVPSPEVRSLLDRVMSKGIALKDQPTMLEKALVLAREKKDRIGEGEALALLGACLTSLHRYEQSVEVLRSSIPIWREVHRRDVEAATLFGLGEAYDGLNDRATALDMYGQALSIFQELRLRAFEASASTRIAKTYGDLGERGKALDFFGRALQIQITDRNRPAEADLFNGIGAVYGELGAWNLALNYFQRGLPIWREIRRRGGEAQTLSNMGVCYDSLGDKAKALDYDAQALAIFREIHDHGGEATALVNLGAVRGKRREWAEASRLFQQALAIEREVGDEVAAAMVLVNLGYIGNARGEHIKAIEYMESALLVFQRLGEREREAATLSNIAGVYQDKGAKSLAILFGKRAINIYQTLRADARSLEADLQLGYLGTLEGKYRYLADLLAAQGRITEAQQVLDLLKDDEYFRLLRRRAGAKAEALDLTPVETKWLAEYDKLSDPIGKLGAEKAEIERLDSSIRTPIQKARLVAIDAELAQSSRAFQTFLDGLKGAFAKAGTDDDRLKDVESSQALSRTLAKLPGTAAIYTLVTEDHVRTILCLPGAKAVGQAPTKVSFADLSKKVLAFRQALQDPTKDPRPLGAELYDLLIRPIEPVLKDGKVTTLLWSLDSVLRYVPLWALYDRTTNQYLVQKYPSALFTPRTVDRLAEKTEAPKSVAAFGVTQRETVKGLDGTDIEFPALPGVGAELAALGESYPTAPKADAAFTEAALLAGLHDHPSILHIATHFRLKPGNDADSFLLLGGNGKLTLEEFKNLPDGCLNDVDLLVLSACETAVGSVNADGSEFEGFSLLAQNKGAGAVLATLWPVSDDATAALMRNFYRLRKANPTWTKLQCLTAAQLALITDDGKVGAVNRAVPATKNAASDAPPWPKDLPKLSHPYYWAPFVLIGNSR